MRNKIYQVICTLSFLLFCFSNAAAAPAVEVLGKDYVFFSGEYSNNLPSQRWMKSVVPDATLYVYTNVEQGDHFLMLKNPIKFTADRQAFLER